MFAHRSCFTLRNATAIKPRLSRWSYSPRATRFPKSATIARMRPARQRWRVGIGLRHVADTIKNVLQQNRAFSSQPNGHYMKLIKTITLACCIFASTAAFARSNEEIQKYLVKAEKSENIKLNQLRGKLNKLRDQKRDASKIKDGRLRRDALDAIREKEDLLKLEMKIIREYGHYPGIFHDDFEVGAIGTVTGDDLFETYLHHIIPHFPYDLHGSM